MIKMKSKRLFALLLAAVLLCGILPAPAFAEEGVKDVTAMVVAPVDGAEWDRNPMSGDKDKYTVSVDGWYLIDDALESPKKLEETDVFELDKSYELVLRFTAKEGVFFDESCNAKVNELDAALVEFGFENREAVFKLGFTAEPVPAEVVSVDIRNTWNDDENLNLKRPEGIIVRVMNGTKELANKTVTEKEGWQWSFTNLPKLDSENNEIVYTLIQEPIEDYNTEIVGYEISNTYAPHVHSGVLHEGYPANCTNAGEKSYYVCSCGKLFEDELCTAEITELEAWKNIPADPNVHDFSAPCDAALSDEFNHYHVCSVCGSRDAGEAHQPGEAATEYTAQTCTVCAYEISPALGHTHSLSFHEGFAATCTTEGVRDYYGCACGRFFTDSTALAEISDLDAWKLIPVNPENHSFAEGYDIANADEAGHYRVCSACGGRDPGEEHIPGAPATETTAQTCTACGYILNPPVSHSHEGVPHIGSAATCVAAGEKDYYSCSCGRCFEDAECNNEISELDSWKLIPADPDNHSFAPEYLLENADTQKHYHLCTLCSAKDGGEEHIPGPDATETTAQLCTVCGFEIKPAIGHIHKPELHTGFEANCVANGEKNYYTCPCGKAFEDEACTVEISDLATWKVIPKNDSHAWSDTYLTENADEGSHYHVCTRCGAKDGGAAHEPGPAATETTAQTCKVCSYVIAPAVSHVHQGTLHEGYAATCTAAGEKSYYICSCGRVFEDAECKRPVNSLSVWKVLPADLNAHTWSSGYIKDNSDAYKHYRVCVRCGVRDSGSAHTPGAPATATSSQICTACGYVLKSAVGHTHQGSVHNGFAATCVVPGEKTYYTCICGKAFEDAACTREITDLSAWKTIPAGHKFGQWQMNDAYTHKKVCVCGTVSMEEHKFDGNNTCTVCSYKKSGSGSSAGGYTITGGADQRVYKGSEGDVTITCGGEFSKFTGLTVDGKELSADNYTVSSGSTVVTLKKAYVKTLSLGTHTVKFLYTDGSVQTQISIREASAATTDGKPKTGDTGLQLLWIALLLSGTGMAATVFYGFKRKKAK